MKKYVIPAMLLASLTFATSCGSKQESSTEVAEEKNEQKFDDNKMAGDSAKSTDDDRDFMVEAASGGMMEVELGKLASTNASSPAVKAFGQQMVSDHTKANDELKTLAASKNITLPATPGNKHQDHINDLKEKKGADFDKAYIDLMVDDHKEDVDAFQKEANDGKDAEIKAFAAGKVPTLQHHLDMAKSTKDKLK